MACRRNSPARRHPPFRRRLAEPGSSRSTTRGSRAMNRRTFVLSSAAAIACAAKTRPSVAITMDDLNWMPLPDPTEINARLLDAMRKHQTRLALFVIGRNADNQTGRALIQPWKKRGHLI